MLLGAQKLCGWTPCQHPTHPLRGCPTALRLDGTGCPVCKKQPHVFKFNLACKVKYKKEKWKEKSAFHFDCIPFPLYYFTTTRQCLLLTWESIEISKFFVHCRGGTVLWFRESTFFSLGVLLRPDLERLKGWNSCIKTNFYHGLYQNVCTDFLMLNFSELVVRLAYFLQLHNDRSNDLKENQPKQHK